MGVRRHTFGLAGLVGSLDPVALEAWHRDHTLRRMQDSSRNAVASQEGLLEISAGRELVARRSFAEMPLGAQTPEDHSLAAAIGDSRN